MRPKVKRRDEILQFIAEYAIDHHNAPNTRRIAREFGIAQQTVYIHLIRLVADGRLLQIEGDWKIPGAEYSPPVTLHLSDYSLVTR